MSITSEFFFPSSDGKTLLHVNQWTPVSHPRRGVVLIAHGVAEYGRRYERFARFLCANGFVVVAHDHLGHGQSVADGAPRIFFGEEDGWQHVVDDLAALQQRKRWTMWQYYTLGKLTHYLADAFTYPHNETYPDSLMAHRQYEDELRMYLAEYLQQRTLRSQQFREDLGAAISELHRQYLESRGDLQRDVQYILQATAMLMAGCCPNAAV